MNRNLLLIIIVLLGHCLCAQEGTILYTDYDPDLTQTFHNYVQADRLEFDLDKDGVSEWLFTSYYSNAMDNGIALLIRPNVANSFPEVDTLGFYRKLRLKKCQFGDTLSNINWEPGNTSTMWCRYYGYENPGFYSHDMFGARYLTNNGFCYAWFEISVECDSSSWDHMPTVINLTVHRSAYCTRQDYPLRAGQINFTWDIPENENFVLAFIYPNPTNGSFNVRGKNLSKIEVYNTLGQRIANVQPQGDVTTVELGNQPAGMYFIDITDQVGRKCVKKVVKQ